MRKVLLQAALLFFAIAIPFASYAQKFPTRPVRLIVPYPQIGRAHV